MRNHNVFIRIVISLCIHKHTHWDSVLAATQGLSKFITTRRGATRNRNPMGNTHMRGILGKILVVVADHLGRRRSGTTIFFCTNTSGNPCVQRIECAGSEPSPANPSLALTGPGTSSWEQMALYREGNTMPVPDRSRELIAQGLAVCDMRERSR